MSDTFSIACKDCKKHLWIAQGWRFEKTKGHMYSKPEYIGALYKFFREHQGHNLVFDENCDTDIADYDEIEVDDE